MKVEINIETKEKFIAQYWGQKIGATKYVGDLKIGKSNFANIEWLNIKPLSSISDGDAIEFFDIVWGKVANHNEKGKDFKIEFGKDWALSPLSERYGLIPSGLFHGVDFLRSRGYLVPWMGLSCEEIIEAGLAKYV